jgi:hypothetical protein
MKNVKVLEELEYIYAQHGGILKAEDVVEFAKNPETSLHDKFTWDNTEAAHQWRLQEARMLIRIAVTIIPGEQKEYRAYVSLTPDRKMDGGGYRTMVSILDNAERLQQLLADARKEWETFKAKYRELKHLGEAFSRVDEALGQEVLPLTNEGTEAKAGAQV